jgi:hypothetical protein
MKVRLGDRFWLGKGSVLQILYYQDGRQETWSGPARLQAGESQGKPLGKTRPTVAVLPGRASREVRRVPVLLRHVSKGRAGGTLLRSGDQKQEEVVPLDEEELAELDAAREMYTRIRKDAHQDDITPELYLLGVLYDLELYREMLPIVQKARARQPDSKTLVELEAWVKKKTGE